MVMSYPNHQFPEMAERLANSDNNYTILVAEKWSFNDTTKKSTYWLRQIKYERTMPATQWIILARRTSDALVKENYRWLEVALKTNGK